MELNYLYSLVLMLVMVGMILGIGILVLDQFGSTAGITAAAQLSLNDTRDALGTISSTWLPLIVTVSVLAIIIVLVIRSFGGGARR